MSDSKPLSEADDAAAADDDDRPATSPDGDGLRSAAEPRPPRRLALLGGVVGLLIGLGAGVLVARSLWLGKPPPAPACPPAPSAAASTDAPATRPSAVAVDMGTLPEHATLEGTWNPRARMDDRDVAITTGKAARVVVATKPGGADQVVSVIAKAVGIKLDDQLQVALAIQDKEATKWSLSPRWSLLALPMAGKGSGEQVTVDFTIEDWANQAGTDGAGPAVAVDQITVGAVGSTARQDLRSPAGRASLLDGFYAVEGPGCDEPWAWSKGLRSTVGLLLDPISGGYKLRIHAAAFDQLAPLTIQTLINDKEVGSFDAGELQEHLLDVADDVLTTGANIIEFRYPRTARPAEFIQGSQDERQLAMRLYAIGLTPVSH